jgi:hypothetical protein
MTTMTSTGSHDRHGPAAVVDMLDKAAITDVLYRYCRGLDRMDRALSRTAWHSDGTAHYGGLFEGTGHDFVDWVFELHRSFVAHSHQITNVIIELDGERAASEAYVTVRLRQRGEAGQTIDIVGVGRYLDRWSYRHGRWAIDHRQYVSDITDERTTPPTDRRPPIRPASAVEPLRSRRGHDDPSYGLLQVLVEPDAP